MRDFLYKYISKDGILGIDQESIVISILLLLSIILIYLTGKILKFLMMFFFKKIHFHKLQKQGDIFRKHHIFRSASHLLAPLCFLLTIQFIFPPQDTSDAFYEVVTKIIYIYLFICLWRFLTSLVSASEEILAINHNSIHGFIQIIQILISLIVLILGIAMLLDKSPFNILAGLGASTAVMMFVFKDTLLGFMASVQLSTNNMLKVGDWITMPKYDADGIVIEIGLTAVKIKNWDNTITNVPTYNFVSDSYQNWRGMNESGGRRVMRSIFIDMQSIKFCDETMLNEFEKISVIKNFLLEKQEIISAHNSAIRADPSSPLNEQKITNLEVFRRYLELYIEKLPDTVLSMPHFVRQLQPTDTGLPLQVYFFTTIEWIDYENVQSLLFEHIIAALPYFKLRTFQEESDNPTLPV